MENKDNPIIFLLAMLITLGLVGVGLLVFSKASPFIFRDAANPTTSAPNTAQNRQENGTIKLLGDTFSGYSTFRDADFQKILKDRGITLIYDNAFDQAERAELLNEGKADIYVTTLDQFLKQVPQGKIVGLIDRTIGADAVVLNTKKYPQLKSLNDLQELSKNNALSISYAVDTPSEYLALVLSTKFENFNLSDFETKEVADASEAWDALRDPNQDIAVAVLWEPFITQAKKDGYTVVLSSNDAPTAIVDVIVASDSLLDSQPQIVTKFLESYYRHIDTNIRDPSKLKNQIAKDGNLAADEATAVLAGIDFFTSIEAKRWIAEGILEKRIAATAAVLVLSGEMDTVPQNIDSLYTAQYVDEAASNTEALIELVKLDNPDLAKRLMGEGDTIKAVPAVSAKQASEAPNIGSLEINGEVKFMTDSAMLDQSSQKVLDNLAQEIQEFNPQTVAVRVIGHTSRTGSPQFNHSLSHQRAEAVANALRQRGLKHNISTQGLGANQPLPEINPTDNRQQRTEIQLVRID